MILPIDDTHRIVSDPHQWIVQRAEPPAKKRSGWENIAYYPTLRTAVEGLGERLLRESEAEGWAEARAEAERLTRVLCEALRPYPEWGASK